MADVDLWRRDNAAAGLASVIYAYALGKAQRVLANVDPDLGPIFCHGAVEAINDLHRAAGVRLPETRLVVRRQDQLRRRPDCRAAVGRGQPLAQALRRIFRCAGQRLDAGARQPPPARAGPRLRDLRPRRLAGAAGSYRGDRREPRAHDPRLRGGAVALSARAGPRRPAARRQPMAKKRRQRREGFRRTLPPPRPGDFDARQAGGADRGLCGRQSRSRALGEHGLARLFSRRRQAAPERADAAAVAAGGRAVGPAGMARLGKLQQCRRSRRDAVAAAAARRRVGGPVARRLDARAAADASPARGRAEIRAPRRLYAGAADRPAAGVLQAHHRRNAGRRLAAAGHQGALRGRAGRREATWRSA